MPLLLVFLPLTTGFFLVTALGSDPLRCCRHLLFRLIAGAGFGIGLCSECYFTGLVSGVSSLVLETVLLIAAAAAAIAITYGKAKCSFCEASTRVGGEGILTAYLAGAFGFLLLLDLAVFSWVGARTPRGGWDAWAIWNLRAHFLYRGEGLAWRDAFTEVLDWSHPDYPLLLPAFVARGWKLAGGESSAVPIGLAGFFTFGCAGLMSASIGILRGTRQGLLAGLALAATPFLYVQGAMQCADVPVAFFRLVTLAAMAMADRFNRPGFAVLAGAAAALDGWTKNEGLLWLAAFLLARVIVTRGRKFSAILVGALPVLLPIAYFKERVASSSDIFGAAGRAGMMARVMDPGRYLLIAKESLRHVWEFGPLLISAFVILGVYLIAAGVSRKKQDVAVFRTGTLSLLFTAAGYFAIYLLRPLDLKWLLDTSADRLLLQLWPALVFLVFLAARAPHRVSGRDRHEVAALSSTAKIRQPAELDPRLRVHG